MKTQALMRGRIDDSEAFRPLPMTPTRGLGSTTPRLAARPGRRNLGATAGTDAIQANLMQPSPVPNWGIYAGSALLVTGGVLGLMVEEKSVFSVALGATMIGVGGFLFFQTLKQG